MADPGDRLVDMPLVAERHIAKGAPRSDKLTGQAEEVADHQIGKPVALEFGQAIKQEKAVRRLGRDDPVYLHGKSLKANGGIQCDFPDVRSPGLQDLGGDQFIVISEAEVDHGPSCQRLIHDELSRHIHISSDILDLPGYGVAGPQLVKSLVQSGDPRADDRRVCVHRFSPPLPFTFCFQSGICSAS